MRVLIFIILLIGLQSNFAIAQTIIKGSIIDDATRMPLAAVNIKNIYTQQGMSTDSTGKFTVKCKAGELIEFTHVGYNTVRVRIKNPKVPEFYNIVMQPKSKFLREIIIRDKNLNFTQDSITNAETYQIVLAQPNFDDYNLGNGLMAGLSKAQRQKWAFMDMMDKWEKDKYVDYMFNEKKIAKWTNMPAEKLKLFMRMYRPTYEFIRNNNEYTFIKYIKDAVADFCPMCEFNIK